ncbi:hypothetical protein GCM10022210_23450 [Mucilaginibacter dorajii]|uniref:Secretion system C-terminal sorting domain-containing protein n=1 Tax=Mucilaginibacter dorajii TaxID=692994 RepID=A0ABP7PXI4_9SPHI
MLTNNSGATFNLGSTSNITFKNTRSSPNCSVTNSGTFTLESDQYGSASIGQSGTTPNSTAANNNQFTGLYNVQRYISGGSGNRGYRLLSIPVNVSSNTIGDLNASGTGNISFANLNSKTTTVVNGNAVVGTVTVPGAYTGGPSGGFSTVNANPTLYVYDETKTTSTNTFTGGKTIGIASISGSTVKTLTGTTTSSSYINIPVTTGFMLYFIGDANRTTTASTPVPENTTITSIGTLNQANITFKLWNTSATTMSFGGPEAPATGKKGFNLVGNPYPCTIDLHQLWLDNSSAAGWVNFTVVKSLGTNQTFASYNASTGFQSDPTLFTQYVPSGGAFFIQATTASQTVIFKEDIKTTSVQIGTSTTPPLLMSTPKSDILASTAGTAFKSTALLPFSQRTPENAYQVLHLKLEKDSTLNDWCAVAFNKAFDDKYDHNDAYDMDGFAPKVFMSSYTSDGVRTGINTLGEIGTGKKVKLYVKSTTDGLYALKMPDINNIDLTQYKVNLIDNFKKDSLDIGKYGVYNFNITNADTSSFGGNRFVLSIQQLPGAKYQLTKFTAQKAADGVFLNWVTKNEGSNYFFTLEKQQANGTDYAPLYTTQGDGSGSYKYTDKIPAKGSNIYRLKQVDLLGNITYSDLVSIDYDQSGNAGMFSVYPNPTAETLNVNVTYGKNTTTASSYKLNIYDATGSLVMQKTSDNTAWSENVENFKPGIYIVELKGNDGYSLGKAKFVKK